MEKYEFADIIAISGNKKANYEVEELTLKQISRAVFEYKNDHIETEIITKNGRAIVNIDNRLSTKEFRDRVFLLCTPEPSTQFFLDETSYQNTIPLVDLLLEYKKSNRVGGEKLLNKIWYKFYSKTPLEDSMRDVYHANWIDYSKQLQNGDIIYDETGLNGIFAMSADMIENSLNEEVIKRYGDQLLVVSTLPDNDYLIDGKEIIGLRYKAIDKMDLSNCAIEDVGKLVEYERKRVQGKVEKIIKEKDETIREDGKILNDVIERLKDAKAILIKYKWQRIAFLLVGMVIGVLIGAMFDF